jgi:RNA polymerase sigma-70 factor (ECF subfamily)
MPQALEEFDSLINRARGGDDAASGTLLQSYNRYLTLLARVQIGRRLRRKVDEADIVQDTLMEAHRQIANFRGGSEGELLSWLRRILAGKIALTLRHYLGVEARDINLERDLAVQLDQSATAMDIQLAASMSSPSQRASRREQAVLLADALAKLPEDYREAIILRNLEGMSFADVAKRMERSEDAVQKLWVRGLASLRMALGEQN